MLLQDDRSRREIGRRLLEALERVRSRLAVAMAAEMKAAPPECRRHYQETEDRMRRCVKDVRIRSRRGIPLDHAWIEALEALGRIPAAPPSPAAREESVRQLCTSLGEVLTPLERGSPAKGPPGPSEG